MSLTVAIEDGGLTIVGSEEELRSFAETLVEAADDGDSSGQLLNDEGVSVVRVIRRKES